MDLCPEKGEGSTFSRQEICQGCFQGYKEVSCKDRGFYQGTPSSWVPIWLLGLRLGLVLRETQHSQAGWLCCALHHLTVELCHTLGTLCHPGCDIPAAHHLGCPENMRQLNRVKVFGRVRPELGTEFAALSTHCGLWFGTSATVPHFSLLLVLSQQLCGHEDPPPL